MATTPKPLYDCGKCPGICCSIYGTIAVTPKDAKRFARVMRSTVRSAWKRMAVEDGEGGFRLRKKKDSVLGSICRFFDTKKRSCSVYEARPDACRAYPGQRRCVYFDVLKFERSVQESDVVPRIHLRLVGGAP